MGDEELNFTEEEALPWADDPQNQPRKDTVAAGTAVACILFLIAALAMILAAGTGRARTDLVDTHVGTVLVR